MDGNQTQLPKDNIKKWAKNLKIFLTLELAIHKKETSNLKIREEAL